jgi:hypothetical protein
MAGCSGKPLVQKLGIQPGFCIFIEGAPAAAILSVNCRPT